MTISSETRKAGPYDGNGVTTSFPFTFKTFAKTDVKVIFTDSDAIETTLVLNTDYTINLNVDQNANPGGTVIFSTLATGEKLTLLGDVDYTQETDIQNQGGFYPEVIENALDKLTMQVQQVNEKVERAVKVDVSSSILPVDYITQAAASATNAAESASAASASEIAALNSATAAAISASEIVGFEWASSWITGFDYLKNNLVSESGNTYIALSDHTSGTFSTDFSNGLWAIFASKGAPGAGTGDMLAANNLSEVNPNTARANLSAAKSGANTDITSLSGLTTALSAAQGGTGLTVPGAAGNVLTSDGDDWVSSPAQSSPGGLIGYQVFTSSGTYSKSTNNPSFVIVEVVGGGGNGGGAGSTNVDGASGGGAGGYSMEKILATSLAASETVTVGAATGTSSFGSFLSATGGSNGVANTTGSNAVAGGAGGTGSGGDINLKGGDGSNGGADSTALGLGGNGGNSKFGGAGRGGITNGNGVAAGANTGSGGGGGGQYAGSGGVGGAGGSGIVIVWEYA